MQDRKWQEMQQWLQARKDECAQEQARLRAQGRQDEAVFQQIRMNVFGLTGPVLAVSMKLPNPEEEFLRRMTQIPSAWETARQKAEAHGDSVQVHLETIKLQAAEEIRQAFMQIRSEPS